MSTVQPLRLPTQEEASLNGRTEAVKTIAGVLRSGMHGVDLLPGALLRVIRLKAWEEFTTPLGTIYRNRSLLEWISAKEPQGLGSSVGQFKQILTASEKGTEALLAFDRETRRNDGGANNPNRDEATGRLIPRTEDDILTVDIIHGEVDKAVARPTGTSSQAGLRRLEKAAEAGDGNAADMLRRVLDPNDPMTVNGACVHMGWRQPTKTVVDTDDGMSDAVVRRLGPIDTVRQAWKRASVEQREEIAAWVDEQMSPVRNSRFG